MSAQIRLAAEGDAAQVRAIYAPFCTNSAVSFEEEAPTVEEMRRRIAAILTLYPWLVCVEDDQVLGYVYAQPYRVRAAYRWSTEVTAYIAERSRRRGVGRALYTSLIRILTLQGIYSAFAGITLPNPASVGLHEAVGFRHLGVYRRVGYKFGAWHDVGWWQLAIQPHIAHPDPPRDLPAVQGDEGWESALHAGLPLL
jgi:phosphinothricin acetyltransferase